MAMSGTVKLPGVGEVKKTYAVAAGAVLVGIVGIGYYRKRQADNAVPVTSDQTSVDAFGDTAPVGPGGSNGVTNQFGDPAAPQIVQTQPGIDTNSDWLTAAQSMDIGIPETSITSALTHILAGVPTTQAEQQIFHTVVALINYPPQGYPPLKLTTGSAAPPPTTTPAPAKPKYEMVWAPVNITGSYVGITLAALQNSYTQQAAGLGAAKVNAAVRASYISQASVRNNLSPNAKLRAGQIIQVRKAQLVH